MLTNVLKGQPALPRCAADTLQVLRKPQMQLVVDVYELQTVHDTDGCRER